MHAGLIRVIVVKAAWHFTFSARLLHLPRGFYTFPRGFYTLPRGFCTCRVDFSTRLRVTLHRFQYKRPTWGAYTESDNALRGNRVWPRETIALERHLFLSEVKGKLELLVKNAGNSAEKLWSRYHRFWSIVSGV